MKKNFLIMAMLLASQQAMAALLLALPPAPQFLALPPAPLQNPFLKLLKSKAVSSMIRSFLSFEDENALSLSSKSCAKEQKHLKIAYNTSREEELCDIFLRKDIRPCLESLIVTKRGLSIYLIQEKILGILEKNKKTLRKVALPFYIFPRIRILNAQGLNPLDEKGKEETVYYTDLHLRDFPKLKTLKILHGYIGVGLLEGVPNLKTLDIGEGHLQTKSLENMGLTKLNINHANLKDQDNPFSHLPFTLKKLNMNNAYHQGKSGQSPLPLFLNQLNRFKNLEYLFFDVSGFIGEIKPILKGLPLLKQLHIAGFAYFEDSPKSLEGLSDLKNLTHLSLTKAEYLEDFSEIFKLTKLKYLDLSGSCFNECRESAVWLTRNITNQSLNGIENLTELRYLGLANTGITDLRPIQNLKKLEHLNLAYVNTTILQGIENLENLKILDLAYSLQGLPYLLNMKEQQLLKLTVFLGCEEAFFQNTKKVIIVLKEKGVRFLQPDNKPIQSSDDFLNTAEMAKAYKESPFLYPAYRWLIEN